MKVKVFQTNSNGKIELTCAELEKLLNETYENGHRDGYCEGIKGQKFTWTPPTLTNQPYGGDVIYATTTDVSDVCVNTSDATNTTDNNKTIESANINNTSKFYKCGEYHPDIDGILSRLFNKENDNIFTQLAKELAGE